MRLCSSLIEKLLFFFFFGGAIPQEALEGEENKEYLHWFSMLSLAKAGHMTLLNYKVLEKCKSVFPERKKDWKS